VPGEILPGRLPELGDHQPQLGIVRGRGRERNVLLPRGWDTWRGGRARARSTRPARRTEDQDHRDLGRAARPRAERGRRRGTGTSLAEPPASLPQLSHGGAAVETGAGEPRDGHLSCPRGRQLLPSVLIVIALRLAPRQHTPAGYQGPGGRPGPPMANASSVAHSAHLPW